MGKFDYWDECVAISFEENGITATAEQIKNVAGDVESAHDNYGMAFYQPPSNEHSNQEIARLKRELVKERDKVICRSCNGYGRIISYFGTFQSNSQCDKCNGDGRHSP